MKREYEINPDLNILCDDSTVRVLSGIPESRFVDSSNCPAKSEPFLRYLKKNSVEYLVFGRMHGVIPAGPFSEFAEMEDKGLIQPAVRVGSRFYSLEVYRLNSGEGMLF